MHILNFLVTILLPYVTLFYSLRPPDSVPDYFASPEAAFLSGEFYAIVFYWSGFMRDSVDKGSITERNYFAVIFTVLILMCICKLVFALPYTWIISSFAFGLGVLSATQGQGIGRVSLTLMVLTSLLILSFTGFMLIGMAWFGFTPTDYYYYINILEDLVHPP